MVSIPKTSAHLSTSLANKISSSDSSFIVVSGTDKAGNALSGLYGWVIDKGSASEEFMLGTISGTTVTITARGLDPGDGKTEVTALKLSHRRGASVDITDYPMLAILARLLNADETIPNVLSYASHPTYNANQQLADKEYVDSVAVAGASNADDTTKGIVERATQAEIEAGTGTGGTGAALFVAADRLGARLYYGYAVDSVGTDSYAITVAPVPTAYTAGMVFVFKAGTANTGACTLNVNSLGAKSLKVNGVDPRNNYILSGQIVICVYDGTNLEVLSVGGQPQISQDGAEIYAASSSGNDTYAITVAPTPAAYVTGQRFYFKPDTANTGACTLNVNSLGAKSIKRYDQSGALIDLLTGDIVANQVVCVVYDGTIMQMVNPISTPGLGAWAAATVDGAAHQVTQDSFLVVQSIGTGSGTTVTILSDSANPPTTQRAKIVNTNSDGGNATVPVKKNDYYKITASGGTTVAYLIPLNV